MLQLILPYSTGVQRQPLGCSSQDGELPGDNGKEICACLHDVSHLVNLPFVTVT